jgi:hypothetical protein
MNLQPDQFIVVPGEPYNVFVVKCPDERCNWMAHCNGAKLGKINNRVITHLHGSIQETNEGFVEL